MNGADKMLLLIGGILLFLYLTTRILQPYFEADAYNRLTGKKVTYWDAVWLDLRIQEQIK